MTFRIEISQFFNQNELRQWKLNKIGHFPTGHIQI